MYELLKRRTLFFFFFCAVVSCTPVSQQCCLQTDNPPLDLSDLRPRALSIDYSNKETPSVLLKLSNFAIKCLPGYLVAEHQILLLSDSQKAYHLDNPLTFNHGSALLSVKHLL